MSVFLQLLERAQPVIVDGGLATELERYGCDLRDALWSSKVLLSQPDAIVRVHRDYLAAGAEVIATATYQATFEGFAQRGLSTDEATGVFEQAVDLALTARREEQRDDAAIAGSIGSYGAFLADGSEYRGDYGLTVDALVAFHRARIQLLAPRVDVVACETIPSLPELRALAICLQEVDTPAWVSLSCADAEHMADGATLRACADALRDVPQVVALGVNCISPSLVEALTRGLQDVWDRALIVYPNSGESYDGRWDGMPTPPAEFAELAPRWCDAGATLVGGCCRTTPEHIRAVVHALGRG